ncbi:hypothetical protein [Halomarina rubra]|uniref:Uncharacterized protein n=1 Tax=Halomarina rubra TaxID=2071873 RepID=A0ABD6APU4_9EURY|nr:hypothetical protein [Halomarina rubra]
MQNALVELFESIPEMIQAFADIAFGVGAGGVDPFQLTLLLSGSLFVGISVVFFGYLVFGALVRPLGNLPTPGRGHRDRREEKFRGN